MAGPTGLPRDHPRVCEEHSSKLSTYMPGQGPSPHAQGALQVLHELGAGEGTIPACARSTPPCSTPRRCPWDHPRVRGEHYPIQQAPPKLLGPSPRARGARGFMRPPPHGAGTIPAGAGSTNPHRVVGHEERNDPGTIPACARSTPPNCRRTCRARDHPRMREEHVTELGTYQRQETEFPISRETDIPPTKPSPNQPMVSHTGPAHSPSWTESRRGTTASPSGFVIGVSGVI